MKVHPPDGWEGSHHAVDVGDLAVGAVADDLPGADVDLLLGEGAGQVLLGAAAVGARGELAAPLQVRDQEPVLCDQASHLLKQVHDGKY